jgi:serine/threonine-protein kinase
MFATKEVLLIMELIEGRNLVRERPDSMAGLLKVFIDAAAGLDAMHRAGYLHADMKPNNILLTPDGRTKVIDYGQSCEIGTIKKRIQGTPDYIAPEQVKRRKLTPETDVYNLGASLYWCLTDTHIPTLIPKDPTKTKLRIRNINIEDELIPPSELVPSVPAPLNNLIVQCLKTRPDERPGSMADVKTRLEVIVTLLERNGGKGRHNGD